MTKRITLAQIRAYDAANIKNESCLVRQLEMEVDYLTINDGYSVQFFRDLNLYGLREAIRYLKNHCNQKNRTDFNFDFVDIEKIAQVIELKLNG